MEVQKTQRKLWEHPDPKSTAMWKFMVECNEKFGLNMKGFDDLYEWSCKHRAQFYGHLWETQHWIHEGSYKTVVDESIPISRLPRWFEGVRLNWAENFLWTRGLNDAPGARTTVDKEDSKIAMTEIREGMSETKHVSWKELRHRVGQMAAALKARGVKKGDRVVVVAGHASQTLVVCLATTWLGALFSTSSTDMGVNGLLQRTVQINPKFVFFDDGALYNGKITDLRDKIQGMMEGMKACSLFEKMVVIQRFAKPYDTSAIANTERVEDFLKSTPDLTPPPIERFDFQHPIVVYYSSGTTGAPKAIVHAAGPLLVNSKKEGILHRRGSPSDVSLQYTTTGWIMYKSSIATMAMGGRTIAYDGSPFQPDPKVLLRIVEREKATVLGISPRWMTELMKNGIAPRDVADMSSLARVVSTGMVLPDQLFDWFYDKGFPSHVQLCNISGGTDIAGTFVQENPIKPLYRGGCMGGSLGVPIAVYDHDVDDGQLGKPVAKGIAGDLVATAAFPNIPQFLWNDGESAPGPKYHDAYFARFKDVWAQGDFCQIDPQTGAMFMLGRSDGVLNPSGIRFGSSDIYAVVEKFFPQISESICVGQRRPQDVDERVLLFLLMKPGQTLDNKLVTEMKNKIAQELTKRHVPKYIFQVPEIPTTVNGKKVELPIKKIVCGKTVKPSGTLLNPQSLEFYYRFQKIESLTEPQAKL